MLKHRGGDAVKKGFYGSIRRWTIEMIKADGGMLPGTPDERYVRLPVIVVLIAAPVMGLAFAVFLPFIGFVMLGAFGWRKLTGRPPEGTDVRAERKAA
ncbi:MAG: hypothetical protein ACM3SQ_08660 [Betaproteobacteria bacterium]